MTAQFLKRATVHLTPISPVHVGCGEVYEPTQFVVEDGILYAFDPTVVPLTSLLRSDLLRAAKTGELVDLASFFNKNAKLFIPASRAAFPVDASISKNYRVMVNDKNGRGRNEIFRTAFVRRGEDDDPYIPGSSVKGAVHTALVDRIHQGKPVRDSDSFNCDREVLGAESFSDSPMRFLKVGDFMLTGAVPRRAAIARRIHKGAKTPDADGRVGQGAVPCALEVIDGGSYRAFRSEWCIWDDPKQGVRHRYGDFEQIVRDLNRKSMISLRKEVGELKASGRADAWVQAVSSLLKAIRPEMDMGRVALVRIGKNQGAEALTLSGGIARIRIARGPNRGKAKPTADTQFFLTQGEEIVPFGWCLLEWGDAVLPALRDWCGRQRKSTIIDLQPVRAAQREAREAAIREKAEIQRRREAEAAQQKAEAERLSSMSEEAREVDAIANELRRTPGSVKPGSELFGKVMALLERAGGWNVDEQRACASVLGPLIKKKDMYQGKFIKEIKARLRALRNE